MSSSGNLINIELVDVISKGFVLPPGYTWNAKLDGGEKEGTITVMNEEGLIYAELQYKNNELNGECIFYEEGDIKEKITYVNDIADGWSYKFKDGKEAQAYLYEKGKKTKIIEQLEDTDYYIETDINNEGDYVCFTVDDHLNKKGFGYVYKNKKIQKEVEYKDGVVFRTCKSFSNDIMKEYDEENNLIYEGGFLENYPNRCPRNDNGKTFKNGKVIFEGMWTENKPNGKGCLRDELGKVLYDGEWCNGLFIVGDNVVYDYETQLTRSMKFIINSYEDYTSLDRQIPKLVIGENCCNDNQMKELVFSNYPNLRFIEIRNGSCQKVKTLTICDLDILESIHIGNDCFKKSGNMSVTNCSSLQELIIGSCSFKNYNVCELEGMLVLFIMT